MSNNGIQTLESMSQAVWYNQWTMKKIIPHLSGVILEVGCGIGNFTDSLTKYGDTWAIDINEEYITQTRQSIDEKTQVGFGDIERGKYFFNNQKFDTIVCLNVLEHVKDDNFALNNLFKLLKNGGKLILLVPAHKFLYGEIDRSIGHYRRYTKVDLVKELKELGFIILESKRINFLGALGWFVVSKILQKETVGEGNIKMFNLIAPLVLPLENLFEPPIGTSILTVAKKP